MFPMDYEEFRWALGDTATVPLLRQAFEACTPLGDAAHRKMMRNFRLYMLIGGMPQAVAEYLYSNNLAAVDNVKRDILSLYDEDMMKIDSSGKASALFKDIPGQLSRNISRYAISSAVPDGKPDRASSIIKALEDSMTVNIAYHANDPNIGLALAKDSGKFKMYVGDTGLFIALAFMDKDFTENEIYNRLLNDKLKANLGYVYENMVAQMLRAAGKNRQTLRGLYQRPAPQWRRGLRPRVYDDVFVRAATLSVPPQFSFSPLAPVRGAPFARHEVPKRNLHQLTVQVAKFHVESVFLIWAAEGRMAK